MKLEKIYTEIQEGKQVGTLYHYTSLTAANSIIKGGGIKSGKAEVLQGYSGIDPSYKASISFTRDKNFHETYREISTLFPNCRFTINGDALSNKYKIQPVAASGYEKSKGEKFESEEVVLSKTPFTIPLDPSYIISFDMLYDPVDTWEIDGYKFIKTLKQLTDKGIKINLVDVNGNPVPKELKISFIQWLKKPLRSLQRTLAGVPTEEDIIENPKLAEALNVGDKLWGAEVFPGIDLDAKFVNFLHKLYEPDFEPNTVWEDALLRNLKDYFYENKGGKNLGTLLKGLLPLKSKFPRILDPAQSQDGGGSGKPWETGYEGYAWRGATIPLKDLQKLIPQSTLVGYSNEKDPKKIRIDGFAIDNPNFIYKSRGGYGFTSFSIDAYTASHFRGMYQDDRITVVYGVKLTDPNLIMNPDVSNLLSDYKEYETLYVGDKVKPDVIMVTDRRILDKFKDDARNAKTENPLAYFDGWKREADITPPPEFPNLKKPEVKSSSSGKDLAAKYAKMKGLMEVYTEILTEIGEGTSEPFEYKENFRKGDTFSYLIDAYTEQDDLERSIPIRLQAIAFKERVSDDLEEDRPEYFEFLDKPKGTILNGFEIIFSIADAESFQTFNLVNDKVYMFRLMATIKKILQGEFGSNPPDLLIYSPTKEGSEATEDTGRHKLYSIFIKKAFPNAQMFINDEDEEIYFKLK